MGRNCKVCLSPNHSYYDKLRSEGWQIKDIQEISKDKFNEVIGYYSFQRHFAKHYNKDPEEAEKNIEVQQNGKG